MADDFPDMWTTVDFPVLREVARTLEIDHANEVDPKLIVDDLELTVDDVQRSLAKLLHAGFVEGDDMTTLDDPSVLVKRLTEKGRREVRMWPNTLQLGQGFLELIEKAEQDEPDPEKKSRWHQLGETVRNVGEGSLGSIIAGLITKVSV